MKAIIYIGNISSCAGKGTSVMFFETNTISLKFNQLFITTYTNCHQLTIYLLTPTLCKTPYLIHYFLFKNKPYYHNHWVEAFLLPSAFILKAFPALIIVALHAYLKKIASKRVSSLP